MKLAAMVVKIESHANVNWSNRFESSQSTDALSF
jgi:hypothetical protein